MGYTKRNAQVNRLTTVGTHRLSFLGPRDPGFIPMSIKSDVGVFIKSGNLKRHEQQTFSAPNAAITVGIAAASTTNILNAGAISISASTTFTASGLSITYFDVPRTIQLQSVASAGDGTYGATTSVVAIVNGTNYRGESITEWVALNGTSVVTTKKAFRCLLSIICPAAPLATSPTLSVGYYRGLQIDLPVEYQAVDILEISRKASVATAYTIEVLSGHTFDVGFGYCPILTSGLNADGSISINSTSAVGSLAWTNVLVKGSSQLSPNLNTYAMQELFVLASGGTYTLSVTYGGSTQTTGTIANNASASTIQTALTGLSNVGSNNMIVSQTSPIRYLFAAAGTLTGAIPLITVNQASLTGTAPFPLGVSGTPSTGKWIAEIDYGNGKYEEILITAATWVSATQQTLTVVRSADATTAQVRYDQGQNIVVRPQMTVTPTTLTANDRFFLSFRSGAL